MTVTRRQRTRALVGLSMLGAGLIAAVIGVLLAVQGDQGKFPILLLTVGAVAALGSFAVMPGRENKVPTDPRKRKIRIVAGVMIVIALGGALGNGGQVLPVHQFLLWGGIALLVVAWIMNDQPAG